MRGFLHRPSGRSIDGLVITHGASGNADGKALLSIASALAIRGLTVLRCDLPYRQARPYGPPRPADAAKDREGLVRAIRSLREFARGRMFLGGQSYGGRQATLLAADQPDLVDGLVLLSYPLHPPGKPEQLRTAHFPKLQTRALFVHGSHDPFGTLDEMRVAVSLIPAPHELVVVEGAGHELARGEGPAADAFFRFFE
ncbi:MAG: alpha/beta hydrolase family protein [Bryobacteraceae bacterium]